MLEPNSGHWLAGLWNTIVDYGEYLAGLVVVMWSIGMFSLKSVYVTKRDLAERIERLEEKNERGHRELSDKVDKNQETLHAHIDQIKDLLIAHFSGNIK